MTTMLNLENKTEELIQLALAITDKRADDSKQHIRKASAAGATNEEIKQTLLLAMRKREAESAPYSSGKNGFPLRPVFIKQSKERIVA